MKTPKLSLNEANRINTLHNLKILDTAFEERFDRITRLAQRLFDVPIALVSLIDVNRQWFKSCIGLSVRETLRDISFCGHAILGDEVFVIPDTREDPRFWDNPFVVNKPYIRFYAGCPLQAHNGYKLGTLCIIDHIPRRFKTDDFIVLKDLAIIVERELAALAMATQDELTQINNRRGFKLLAEHELRLADRHNSTATLVFCDLNRLKHINDVFGHAEGDKAIITFVRSMRNYLRHSDIFARLGGDEFVLLLTNSDIQATNQVIERVTTKLKQLSAVSPTGYNITFSFGVIEYHPNSDETLTTLLAAGAQLMDQYNDQANKNGENG